jgi:uncharacterized repeat protein (TIGR01451 family)
MVRMLRALFVCSLLVTFSMFAQSADQEMLSAADSPDPVIPGNNITYTVQVRNNGPDPAVNGGLNMNIAGALTYVSASGPAGFSCFNLGNNASCTNPSFPAGTTATFTVIASVPASLLNFPDGSVTSNFFTSGVTADPNNGNNFLSVTTNYDSPQIDLSLTVADSPDPVFPDGTITYTIPVTNAGPDTATAVNFNSFNNGSLQFQSATVPPGWNCTLPAVNSTATFTCTNPSFAPGTVNFTVVVKAPQSINGLNDGTVGIVFGVNGTGDDTNDNNNIETENTAYVASDADMTVSVSDFPDPVFPDGDITYTVNVGNSGPDAAPNAKLNLFNNGSLQFQSVTPGAGFICAAPAVNAAPTFTCTNPSFASGGNVVFTVVAQADATINGINDGTIQTAFSVSSDVADPNNPNSSETESTAYVTPDADISVTNSDSPDPVSPGATITYTQSITNNGPDAAPNATFTQILESSVGFQSINEPAGWSCTTPAAGASGIIQCTNPSFASGATANFTLVVTVIANSGIVTNTVTGGSNVQDPDHTDDSATVTTTILAPAIADLGITKTTTSDGAAAGASVAYTITLTNNGPDAAANVVVTDALLPELLFQSINVPAGFSCTTPAVGTNGTITCTAASMASGTTVVFTLVVQLTSNAVGPINNTVSATSDTEDDNSGNDSGSAAPVTVGSNSTADLSITKTTTATQAPNGSTITYTITVTNNGPDAANNVVVSDNLPSGLQFVSATPSQGSCSGTDPFTCTLGTLNNGASATISLQALVTATSGTVSNTATVTTDTDDGTPGNNSGSSPAIPVTPGAAQGAAIPTMSEWALLALAMMLGLVAVARMRM